MLLVQKQTSTSVLMHFRCWQPTAKTTFGCQKKDWQPKHVLAAATVGIRGNSTVTKTFGNQNMFWQKTAKTCFGCHS